MMREILFKAKRIDNGEWVYGDLRNYKSKKVGIYVNEIGMFIVKPKTVCQYTGLKDINGIKVFEGDIFSIKENGEPYGIIEYGSWNCGCCYDVYGFYGITKNSICYKKTTLYRDENDYVGVYVVGNIYDKEV